MEQSISIIEEFSQKSMDLMPQIIIALLVVILAILLGKLTGRLVSRFLRQSSLSSTHRNFFRKIIMWLFILVGISVALNILDLSAASIGLLTGGGITALALGIAFRDIGENILAGIYLAFSKPFSTGDLIASGDLEGVVQEVALRHTHVRTYEGTDIFIPNAKVFGEPLLNFTMNGLRRHNFVIGIDYEDDATAACNLLKEKVSKIEHVLLDPPCIVSIFAFNPQYVELKIYYWIDASNKRVDYWKVRNEVMEACRLALKDGGFTFSANISSSNILTIPDVVQVEHKG